MHDNGGGRYFYRRFFVTHVVDNTARHATFIGGLKGATANFRGYDTHNGGGYSSVSYPKTVGKKQCTLNLAR